MSFEYNSSGLRTKKTVGDKTIEYYYAGDLLVAQFDGEYLVNFIYDQKGEAIGFSYSIILANNEIVEGDYCYYVKNAQGDILGFYSMFVKIYRQYSYDAWGNVTGVYDQNGNEITNTNDIAHQNPLRYRGYYYDNETGLYYLRSRYYNPEWGRFISADAFADTGQGLIATNMYAYCLNNPVNYADPTGLACICMTQRVRSNHVCYKNLKIVRTSDSMSQSWLNSFPQTSNQLARPKQNCKPTHIDLIYSGGVSGTTSSGIFGSNNIYDKFFGNYLSSSADQYVRTFLPSATKSSLVSGAVWINTLDDFSNNVGFVSLGVTTIGMIADASSYPYDPTKQAISIGIDCLNVLTNFYICSVIVFPSGGTGLIMSSITCAGVDYVFGLLKEGLLG